MSTQRYLSMRGVATYADIPYQTIKTRWRARKLPPPDIKLGGPEGCDDDSDADAVRPGWLPETIDAYLNRESGEPKLGVHQRLDQVEDRLADLERRHDGWRTR